MSTASDPGGGIEEVMLSTPDLCRRIGVSFRTLDYWCRTGVLVPDTPASGSGTQREFGEGELKVAAVLALLRPLCADTQILGRVAEQIRLDPLLLDGALYVDPEGWCSHAPVPLCWRIDVTALVPVPPSV